MSTPAPNPLPVATPGWRRLLHATSIAVLATGIAWLVAKFGYAERTEFGEFLPDWAAKVLAAHGAAALVLLVALGAWLPVHVVPRWPMQRGLRTGVLQLGGLALLLVTGFGLYYLANESTHAAWSTVHWVAGVALPLIYLLHRKS